MKLDVERFLERLMVVLLTLRAECSLFTSKPAHLSPYLPPNLPVIVCVFAGVTLYIPPPSDKRRSWPHFQSSKTALSIFDEQENEALEASKASFSCSSKMDRAVFDYWKWG